MTGNRRYAIALAVLVIILAVMMVKPIESWTVASTRANELERQRAELASEVEALERRREDLSRPEEIELLAREQLGMVAPGEVPFVVVTPEPEDPEAEARAEGDRPWYADLWDTITRPFR
jgi:cell division protein FtsL